MFPYSIFFRIDWYLRLSENAIHLTWLWKKNHQNPIYCDTANETLVNYINAATVIFIDVITFNWFSKENFHPLEIAYSSEKQLRKVYIYVELTYTHRQIQTHTKIYITIRCMDAGKVKKK